MISNTRLSDTYLTTIWGAQYLNSAPQADTPATSKAGSVFGDGKGKNKDNDTVELSPEGRRLAKENDTGKSGAIGEEQLSEEEKKKVKELQATDRQVRSHEQAHLAAAGGLASGGANFQYETGPDGKRYAVGGEVNIDTGSVDGDPKATLRKAQQIRRAALAPADPSPQDRRIASEATAMAAKAQQELSAQSKNGGQRATGGSVNLYI